MTAAERATLRALVAEAIRAQHRVCEYCGQPMTPGTRGEPKRFCSKQCRVKAWYRDTERGQVALLEKRRRQRRRQDMPRRPNAEKTL